MKIDRSGGKPLATVCRVSPPGNRIQEFPHRLGCLCSPRQPTFTLTLPQPLIFVHIFRTLPVENSHLTFNPTPCVKQVLFCDVTRSVLPRYSFSIKFNDVELVFVTKLLLKIYIFITLVAYANMCHQLFVTNLGDSSSKPNWHRSVNAA